MLGEWKEKKTPRDCSNPPSPAGSPTLMKRNQGSPFKSSNVASAPMYPPCENSVGNEKQQFQQLLQQPDQQHHFVSGMNGNYNPQTSFQESNYSHFQNYHSNNNSNNSPIPSKNYHPIHSKVNNIYTPTSPTKPNQSPTTYPLSPSNSISSLDELVQRRLYDCIYIPNPFPDDTTISLLNSKPAAGPDKTMSDANNNNNVIHVPRKRGRPRRNPENSGDTGGKSIYKRSRKKRPSLKEIVWQYTQQRAIIKAQESANNTNLLKQNNANLLLNNTNNTNTNTHHIPNNNDNTHTNNNGNSDSDSNSNSTSVNDSPPRSPCYNVSRH